MLYDEFFRAGEDELQKLVELVEREQEATCDVVESLGEIEREAFHLTAGYRSLFAYCTVALQYSEPAAVRRIKAARCVRRFRKAGALLRERKLNLTTICLLADVLNQENAERLLEQAAGKSKAEVAELVAGYRPVPCRNLHDEVQTIFIGRQCKKQQPLPLNDEPAPEPEWPKSSYEKALEEKFGPAVHPENYETFLEKRLRVQFFPSPEFSDKLERMRQLLSGKYLRGARLEDVFLEAMDCYIRHNCPVEKGLRALARQKAGGEQRTDKKGEASSAKRSRRIPADIRFQVLLRDGCQCTYVAPDGTRCESREQIQIDHIVPFALGGTHDPENLRCLCRAHNNLEAARIFGEEHMQQFRGQVV